MIHEMAVIGSALFLMALSSLWYSDALFGKQWLRSIGKSSAEMTADTQQLIRSLAVTFAAYIVLLSVLSIALHYAIVLKIDRLLVPTILWFLYAGFITNHIVWEKRSRTYWMISVGFAAVFLFVGAWLITYWPW